MTTTVIIPSNPVDQTAIFNAVKEADASLMRIDAEKDQIKAIIDDVAEKFELDKKYVRRMIEVYHRQNLDVLKVENDDFVTLYETIIK